MPPMFDLWQLSLCEPQKGLAEKRLLPLRLRDTDKELGCMFVKEKWKPPSIMYTGTERCGPREAALLTNQGIFYNLGSLCMCVAY